MSRRVILPTSPYAAPDAVRCNVYGCAAAAAPGHPCPHHYTNGRKARPDQLTAGVKAARPPAALGIFTLLVFFIGMPVAVALAVFAA